MIQILPPSIQTENIEGVGENMMIEVTPLATEKKDTKLSLKKRIKRLLKMKENRFCIDCDKPNPKWAALLAVPSAQGGIECPFIENYFIGGFCCLECSGAHRRLGTHISFVRSTELDSLKKHEVRSLELGGNKEVNNIFEGKLGAEGKHGIVHGSKPNSTSSQKERESFIRQKYEKRNYLNIKALAKYRQAMINHDYASPRSLGSPFSESTSPLSQTQINSPEQQLQIFTSSPRTLAMIEKYMNPKPKKTGFRKMKFSFRKFSRKRFFKGDLRNLRGIVNVNPNINVVETRSDYCPSPTRSELDDDDDGSIESSHSSMSATIRRGLIRGKKVITPKNKWFLSTPKKGSRTPTPKKGSRTPTPKKGSRTPTPNTLSLTPTPRSSDVTPTGGRRRKFFNKNHQANKMHDEDDCFDLKRDLSNPSVASNSDSSLRSRFVQKLKTPRRNTEKNSKTDPEGEHFFAEEVGLDVVNESDQRKDDKQHKAEIKAMRVWSTKLDKVLSKVLKKKRSSRADEVTLLQDNSSSDSFV